jgi:N-acetylglucosamine-6-sulfatase
VSGCSRSSARHGKRLLGAAFLLITAPLDGAQPDVSLVAGSRMSPNIVYIVTDDQRWDTLWAMPSVQSELVAHGVVFSNAFVVNPLCCPSRASVLTGTYSHTHTVYNGIGLGGDVFDDSSTVATWLDSAGYQTGLVGKYLNGYVTASYVPPGWDRWVAFISQRGMGSYFNYSLTVDGLVVQYGAEESDYSSDVLAAEADSFIRAADPAAPVFLYFSPNAPHGPYIPAPRHVAQFSDLEPWRPPSYNEADVSDKPEWVRRTRKLGSAYQEKLDGIVKDQYRTLLAVDEAVAIIMAALADTGRLSNTMVLLSSDNGYLWGEHRLIHKRAAYEESIRTPLVVRYDPLTSVPGTVANLVANIDYAPTFAELAGFAPPDVEGMSLLPLLSDPELPWREDFLVEYRKGGGVPKAPSYCAVRSEGFSYVVNDTSEEELYDLASDPYQLGNVAADSTWASELAALRTRAQELCDPPPPGFAFAYDALAPSVPSGLTAMAMGPTQVDLTWTASTDDVGVTGYTVFRDGVTLATVDGGATSYSDLTVVPSTTYSYTVDAFDAAGNHSAQSEAAVVTTPPEGHGPHVR